MTKMIFRASALVFAFALGSDALAGTYLCNAMKDAAGAVISDGAIYSVQDDQQTVGLPDALTLQVDSSAIAGRSITMLPSTIQSSEGAIYVSDATAVQVIYSIAPAMPGLPQFYIGIQEQIGTAEFQALCE